MNKFSTHTFTLLLTLSIVAPENAVAQCTNVTTGGTISGDQTGCGSYNPSNIINTAYPTGGTGTLQYQWQNSPNGTTWTNINGATLEFYDPTFVASTTYYHRLARRSGCTTYDGTSNTVIKTVNPLPTASITAGGPTYFCSTGSVVLTANAVAGTTYQWRRNNVNIAGATLQSYTATTAGNYQVAKTITATGCTAYSNSITVSVHAPLSTTITEPGFSNCPGSTALLAVQSDIGFSFLWYEDSNPLTGLNSSELYTGHNGTYSCTITNSCGSYPSAPYTLFNGQLATLPYGVITSSGSTSLCTGQSVLLYEVNNLFFSGYQWYKDGVAIAGANGSTYSATLPGNYAVRITDYCWMWGNTYEFYSNWITVTNNGGTAPTPNVTAGGSTTFCQGGSVLLTEATGTGWTYQWQKDFNNIAGATVNTYTATTTGSYRCVVSNICGAYNSNSIAVSVRPTSVTISATSPASVCPGLPVNLAATTAGSGGTYQWKLNGSNISGATSQSYVAITSTGGSYTCTITNACGTYTSNAITVTIFTNCGTGLRFDGVNDHVNIPNNAAYSLGTGNFTVEAWINLEVSQPVYPTLLSDRQSSSSTNGMWIYFYSGRMRAVIGGGSYGGFGPDLRDNVCHHVALVRDAVNSIRFYVDGVLQGTNTGTSGSISTSGALILGNDLFYSPTSYPNFKGRMMDVRMWNLARSQTQIQNARNSQLTGTETGLVGYWKLNDGTGQSVNDYSTTNNDGRLGSTTGVDTNDPSFQATCPINSSVNCALPSGLSATNITNTSAQVNWSGAATADSFMVRYSVHNTTNFVWKKISGQPAVTFTSLTGLLPATQYDWWVRSLCTGIPSSNYQAVPATFTTANTPVPCVTPYGLGTSNIGNTSATVSWTNLVTADTFRVRYSVNGTTNFFWKDVNGSGPHNTSLTGLSPNVTYQFQVSSKCNGLTSAYSSALTFTTLNTPVACITPYSLNATNIQNTSATISWTNFVTADTFRVRYSVNTTTNFIWKDVNGSGPHNTSLTGLSPNTAYQFQVSSKCNGVTSAYSSSYVFTTLNTPVPCIVPYGLSTTNITNNSARVNWTNLVTADTFRVRYSINGSTNYIWKDVSGAGGTTNALLTGLSPSATYQWQVRTICSGQQSNYSQSVLFTTLALRASSSGEPGMITDIRIYPNPANEHATLRFHSEANSSGTVTITDMAGRTLRTEALEVKSGWNLVELDASRLPQGIYIILLESTDGQTIRTSLVVE